MDILEQLRALEKRKKKSQDRLNLTGLVTGRDLPQLREKNKASLQEYVPGEICENEQGTYFLISKSYPADHRQGFEALPENFDLDLLNRLAVGEEKIDRDSPHLVYLDTETTGLAGGAGTFAFLIGLGFWSGEGHSKQFTLLQYFMRDYDEEPALLTALEDLFRVQNFDGVVTYNGRCFDVPLLTTRFISNRLKDRIACLPQIDLLHPVRQLWKLKYRDCSLANIEREVLGVRRQGDIPGEEIPRTYFHFVRGGDPRRLIPIFSHNADDILSLAALTGKVMERLKAAPEEMDPVEVYSLGRMHLRRGALEEASLFLEKSDYELLPFRIFLRSQKELSMAYKQKGEWTRAVELWIQTIETFDPSLVTSEERLDLFAFEELAKYFEHQEKDYARAIEFTRQALELVESLSWPDTEEQLKYRLERLHRKAGIEKKGK